MKTIHLPALSSTHLVGFLLAFLCCGLFGLYMVPRKICRLRDADFVLSMSFGVLASSHLFALAGGAVGALHHVDIVTHALGFSCGLIWYLGIVSYTLSVTEMGLALSTPLKNTTAVIGTIIGMIVFREWRDTSPLPCMIGSLCIVGAALILNRTSDASGQKSQVTARGVLFAIAAACFFAGYTAPFKLAMLHGSDPLTLLRNMSWGIFVFAVVVRVLRGDGWRIWSRQPYRDHGFAVLAGALWVSATVTMAMAIWRIGLAVTWPIANLNTVITVLFGILVFHEIDYGRHRRTIWTSLGVAAIGVFLLGISKHAG